MPNEVKQLFWQRIRRQVYLSEFVQENKAFQFGKNRIETIFSDLSGRYDPEEGEFTQGLL